MGLFNILLHKTAEDILAPELDALRTNISDCKVLIKLMNDEIDKASDINEALRNKNTEYFNEYHEELIKHKRDIECIEKLMELNKLYCYLIPKLMESSGIDLPEDFDITDLDQVRNLHKRFRSGDLAEY